MYLEMKLLLPLSLLPLCALASFFDGSQTHPNPSRYGILSAEDKAKMFQNSNVNSEERRERLERLGKKMGEQLRESQPFDLKEQLDKNRPNENEKTGIEALDIVEINRRAGVAPYLFHGDLDLTEEQLSLLEAAVSEGGRSKRQIYRFATKWPKNTVYYYFDDSINQRKIDSVHAALQYLQNHTCINFFESFSAPNRIRVFNGNGCYSTAGMKGGIQDLSLDNGCESMGTAAHEFIHALGSLHMQSRSDRDDYIWVDTSVIEPDDVSQFAKTPAGNDYIYTPYDYSSVMHYSANAFTVDRGEKSIVPKDNNYLYNMGNGHITFYDLQMINTHYNCNDACSVQNSAKCKNGGLPNPRDCSVCNCPSGYGGDLCDQRPSGCGKNVTATETWQNLKFSFGEDNQTVRDVFSECNHWIQAPEGNEIEVKIVSNFNAQCQYGCPFNGIEIKTESNKSIVSPLICCKDQNNKVFRSSLNPMPIVSYNRYFLSEYVIQYRFVNGSVQPTTKVPQTTFQPEPQTTPSAPVPTSNCLEKSSANYCRSMKQQGFCNSQHYFKWMKYNCASTCGLCGKAANPCEDGPNCNSAITFGCNSLDPMYAEYKCAKTCGFCEHPN